MYAFPKLDANLSCDVAVVGTGITSALIGISVWTFGWMLSTFLVAIWSKTWKTH